MIVFREDSALSDVILKEPSVLTIFNRFGIFLGTGVSSIGDKCDELGIDVNFFLAIINTYLNEDYFPESVLKSFSLHNVLEYLDKTNSFYRYSQLPNIDRHFSSLLKYSPNDNNLDLLRGFFNDMSKELFTRIELDESLLGQFGDGNTMPDAMFITRFMEKERSCDIEERLSDLISFFVIHLRGRYETNLCLAVVSALFTFDKDIRQNNRIRSRILYPMLRSL